eukprot:TRINITY_DN6379_c0_g1_i3.p1 TRINITY_DN6379_c0_g1~~TRINITY_DN6379_c0_g1_i3.p1  ORF type:complete len:528 (-),score=99.97 TRINITY_DN6379_c0_g1_i3:86-1639(-)
MLCCSKSVAPSDGKEASHEHTSSELAATEDDNRVLADMGYKPELYRGFNGFMSLAFCFTAVSVIPSISVGFSYAIYLGGSAELVWAWVVASFFSIISGLAMAEIASVYPSAGSVYHWAGQIGGAEHAPISSFICGWFNWIGNVGGDAAFASGFATVVAYAANMNDSGTELSTGQQVGISIAVIVVWSIMNTMRTDQQGWLNNFAIAFQVSATFIIIIVILVLSDNRASADYVFTNYYDGTGIKKEGVDGYAVILGIIGALFAFSGYEAGAHMAEETRDARTAAPWGITGTVILCSVVGFAYILGMLFATPDITTLENPVQDIYTMAAGRRGGYGLMILLAIMFFFAGMSSTTVTARITFAMLRDGAIPYSEYFRGVWSNTKAPVRSVLLVCICESLLLLLPLGSSAALAAITGTCVVGYQISYAIPIVLRVVHHRAWVPGKWNLGRWSLPVSCVASAWLILSSIPFFWPTYYPVDKEVMNYTVVVVFGVLVLAAAYWLVSARHHFVGPKRVENATPL